MSAPARSSVFLWFSDGFALFSYGFAIFLIDFNRLSSPDLVFSHDDIRWFCNVLVDFHRLPSLDLLFSYGFPMVLKGSPMVCNVFD